MLSDIILGLIGFGLLAYAADQFVLGAARLAAAFKVSTIVIGAVIVGFGTSAPEMLVSGLAAARGELDLAVGNIEGSNVANLTLVLGAAALITSIDIGSTTIRREAPLSVISVIVFAVLVQDGLTRIEGLVLVILLISALSAIFIGSREDTELTDEVDEYLEGEIHLPKEIGRTIIGLAGTIGGAQAVVIAANGIAEELNLTGGFVGLTLVALGTSLPELVTAVAAARKGETDLIVGNLLGSNIFNSLAVGATAALIGPGDVIDSNLTGLAVVIMVGVSLLAWIFMRTGHRVGRIEAGVLLGIYVVSVPLLL